MKVLAPNSKQDLAGQLRMTSGFRNSPDRGKEDRASKLSYPPPTYLVLEAQVFLLSLQRWLA